MLYQKLSLSRFSKDSGSAVFDFVVITVPVTMLILTLNGLFGLAFSVQALSQQAYESARFAALADVLPVEMDQRLRASGYPVTVVRVDSSELCQYQAAIDSSITLWGWPWPVFVHTSGRAICEN